MSAEWATLPEAARHLLVRLADALRVTQLRVFGGAALDLLVDLDRPCRDIDVALPSRAQKRFVPRNGVQLLGAARDYRICYSTPVVVVAATWDGWVLDLNFLDDVHKIGHFDVERLQWDYPACTYADPDDVLGSGTVNTFHLVTNVESENPVLLLNRVLKLAAKYDVAFWHHPYLADLVQDHLVPAAAEWDPDDDFHGRQAHNAHLRALAGGLCRSRHPEAFLLGCLRTGVLDACLKPLADRLRRRPGTASLLANTDSSTAFWTTADHLVGGGSPSWRHYERRIGCDSVS